MSTVPTSTGVPEKASMRAASRRASGAPRVGMPTSTREESPPSRLPGSVAAARSMSWWAMRSTTRDDVGGGEQGAGHAAFPRAGSDRAGHQASFPASLDGSLKEWVGPAPTVLHGRRPLGRLSDRGRLAGHVRCGTTVSEE